ncbi:MAG: hypothetical protein IJ634_06400 [Bacteroidales bacterium]|nr:hypothetical protein [Bacteroidales bacterium]
MSFTTILLLLLVAGYSLYTKASKAAAAQSAQETDSAGEGQDGAFFEEDPFAENANEFFDEGPAEENENGYFTYEAEAVKTPVRKAAEFKPRPMAPVMMEEVSALPKFDLRQAVIAQVILNNNYINEINQQNQ